MNVNLSVAFEVILCVYFLYLGGKALATGTVSSKIDDFYTEESVKKFSKVCGIFYIIFAVFFALMAFMNSGLVPKEYSTWVFIGSAVFIVAMCVVYVVLSKKILVRKR